ncbi:MAG: hypothetical protein DMF68_15580 [Acidobacteria bacterium]|nr:MAG: hypothetical protein DMF68_15580 [Acidobacteriota bacterium]
MCLSRKRERPLFVASFRASSWVTFPNLTQRNSLSSLEIPANIQARLLLLPESKRETAAGLFKSYQRPIANACEVQKVEGDDNAER